MKKMIFATLVFCVLACSAFAQSNTGRLTGTVSGPDGVLPGATIVVTDNQSGRARTVTSGGEGAFLLPQLDIGTYRIKVTSPGFKTYTANDVKIDVGAEYSLNVSLEIGDAAETVTITAGADVVNATNAQLSNTVSPRQILELPLNGRDPTALIRLQAGVASNGAQNLSINGQRPTFTNITRDGINIQDNHIRANASSFSVERPNVDDVNEFTLTTQNASADQGYGASQVQFVTPRGQNAFHGGVWEYNRNSELAANSFFNNASGTQKTFLNRNQFGGKISGPILKNKLFFFGFFEALRLRTQSSQLRTILTPAARQGNFTFTDNNGQSRTVNLFSLLPAAAGLSGIDPIVQSRILANLPAAGNTTDRGDGFNTTGYRFNQRSNTDTDKFTGRFDYDFSEKHTFNGVFSYTNEKVNDRPDVDSPSGFGAAPVIEQPSTRQFLAVAHRWAPSARFTNEIRGGYFLSDPFFTRTAPEPAFYLTLPLISNPEVNTQEQGRDTKSYNLQNNADYLMGNHALRFGGQLQFIRDDTVTRFDTVPRYTLGTNPTTPALAAPAFTALGGISNAQLGVANNLLALLGGIVATGTQIFNVASRTSGFVPNAPQAFNYAYDTYSFYFSDQWRVSPQLSLNLGLRYELFTPLREVNGLALEPVIPAGRDVTSAVLDPNGAVDLIKGRTLNRTDKNNFAPIVGFAFSPKFENAFLRTVFGAEGRTVLRGGFRMSYVNDEILRSQDSSQTTNAGLATTVTLPPINARLGAVPAIMPPRFGLPRTFAQNNAIANNFGPIFAIDPNYQIARSNEYSFGIQREIGGGTAVEIRYVGGFSNNLPRGLDINNFDMISNGFLADFIRARNNLLLTNNAACTAAQNPGCQPLTVFPNFVAGGLVNNPVVSNIIRNGEPQTLLLTYVNAGLQGSVKLRPNENGGVISILENGGGYNYHGLQAEVRRRLSKGLYLQANYTFQKTLTNATGTDQFKFNTNLDNARPELEYARADYDQTHVFNFNGIYELPFGRGKRWLDRGGWINRAIGGFQLTSILNLASGAPITFVDARGTFNRVSRSARQTPQTSLSKGEVKDLIGIYRTPCGVFFINPAVINRNLQTCQGTGRGAEGLGSTPFAGQVFFNNGPGQTGALERAFVNGPAFVGWDASIIKNIQLTETSRLQLRVEAFNLLNRTNFGVTGAQQSGAGGIYDINSANFGRLTTTFAPRILQLAGRFEF
jgi:Carboxypeptidase regulatory-like domain